MAGTDGEEGWQATDRVPPVTRGSLRRRVQPPPPVPLENEMEGTEDWDGRAQSDPSALNEPDMQGWTPMGL